MGFVGRGGHRTGGHLIYCVPRVLPVHSACALPAAPVPSPCSIACPSPTPQAMDYRIQAPGPGSPCQSGGKGCGESDDNTYLWVFAYACIMFCVYVVGLPLLYVSEGGIRSRMSVGVAFRAFLHWELGATPDPPLPPLTHSPGCAFLPGTGRALRARGVLRLQATRYRQ